MGAALAASADAAASSQADAAACAAAAPAALPVPAAQERAPTEGLKERSRRWQRPAAADKWPSPPKARPASPTKRSRAAARAFFYDDSPINFQGADPRFCTTVHCKVPLTVQQMSAALEASGEADKPFLFFFFDFDRTLSLLPGLPALDADSTVDGVLALIFGDVERQQRMREMLGALLEAQACYVLTANQGYEVRARARSDEPAAAETPARARNDAPAAPETPCPHTSLGRALRS